MTKHFCFAYLIMEKMKKAPETASQNLTLISLEFPDDVELKKEESNNGFRSSPRSIF